MQLKRLARHPRLPAAAAEATAHPESAGAESVDELTAAYGEKGAEAGPAAPAKPTPES